MQYPILNHALKCVSLSPKIHESLWLYWDKMRKSKVVLHSTVWWTLILSVGILLTFWYLHLFTKWHCESLPRNILPHLTANDTCYISTDYINNITDWAVLKWAVLNLNKRRLFHFPLFFCLRGLKSIHLLGCSTLFTDITNQTWTTKCVYLRKTSVTKCKTYYRYLIWDLPIYLEEYVSVAQQLARLS